MYTLLGQRSRIATHNRLQKGTIEFRKTSNGQLFTVLKLDNLTFQCF
jgi:hypothetical protein